jgi:hypothetical protein
VRAVKISAQLIERASDTRGRSCASQHSRELPRVRPPERGPW